MGTSTVPWASLVAQTVKNLPAMRETWVQSLGWEDPLEKGTTTHSSILAWRIPRTEEPSRLQSIQSRELDMAQRLSLTHSLCPLTVLTHCKILLIILSLKLMTRWIELQGDHFCHFTIWFSISTFSLGEIKSNYAKVQPGNTWQLLIRCNPSKDLNLIIILLWWMLIMCIWTSFKKLHSNFGLLVWNWVFVFLLVLFFAFLAAPPGMWDLSSWTRDQNCALVQ